MKLTELVDTLGLKIQNVNVDLNRPVKGCYVSDLLSDVMSNAKEGDLWITLHKHQNIVAVAQMRDLSGILLVNGKKGEEKTLKKGTDKDVPILKTEKSAYEIAGRLYELGVGKK